MSNSNSPEILIKTRTPQAAVDQSALLNDLKKLEKQLKLNLDGTLNVISLEAEIKALTKKIKEQITTGLSEFGIPKTQINKITSDIVNGLQEAKGDASQLGVIIESAFTNAYEQIKKLPSSLNGAKDEWKSFLDYVRNSKIKISPEIDLDTNTYEDLLKKIPNGIFSQTSGLELDKWYDETQQGQFMGFLPDSDVIGDQFEKLIETYKYAKQQIQNIRITDDEIQQNWGGADEIRNAISNIVNQAQVAFNELENLKINFPDIDTSAIQSLNLEEFDQFSRDIEKLGIVNISSINGATGDLEGFLVSVKNAGKEIVKLTYSYDSLNGSLDLVAHSLEETKGISSFDEAIKDAEALRKEYEDLKIPTPYKDSLADNDYDNAQLFDAEPYKEIESSTHEVNKELERQNNLTSKQNDLLKQQDNLIDNTADSTDKINNSTSKISDNITDALMVSGVIEGLEKLLKLFALCINSAKEFESVMAGVQRTVGLSETGVSKVGEAFQ